MLLARCFTVQWGTTMLACWAAAKYHSAVMCNKHAKLEITAVNIQLILSISLKNNTRITQKNRRPDSVTCWKFLALGPTFLRPGGKHTRVFYLNSHHEESCIQSYIHFKYISWTTAILPPRICTVSGPRLNFKNTPWWLMYIPENHTTAG